MRVDLLGAVLACNAPGASGPATGAPEITQASSLQVIVITATPPAATSGPVGQNFPTAPPTAVSPRISANVMFAETPDATAGLRRFHAGVTKIYALLQYTNMSEQLLVRRDWYKDGALWITKSDRWSVAKYGRDGTLRDISIYDTQNGLPSGHYELRIYIEDVAQFGQSDDVTLRSFDIAPPG